MGKQYLTFTLADTVYAVNVFQVREVLSYIPPQTLPNPDPVIEGLIRSRGQSISVINLRRRFGLDDRAPDASTKIIVMEIHDDESGEENIFGAVADGVNEVVDLEAIGCEETPELGSSPAADFIQGIGRQDERFIIILDADKIFSFSELSAIGHMGESAATPEIARTQADEPAQETAAAVQTDAPAEEMSAGQPEAESPQTPPDTVRADAEQGGRTEDAPGKRRSRKGGRSKKTSDDAPETSAQAAAPEPDLAARGTDTDDLGIDGPEADIGEFEEL